MKHHGIETRRIHLALRTLPYPRLVEENYGGYVVANAVPDTDSEDPYRVIMTGGNEFVTLGEQNECSCGKVDCFHIEKAIEHKEAVQFLK